jgi:hypothetical protein
MTGESRDLWLEVKEWWSVFKEATTGDEAKKEENVTLARAVFAQLDQLINQGEKESQRWSEVYEVTAKLDRIRDRAFKRLLDAEYLVRADVALARFGQFVHTMQKLMIIYATEKKLVDDALIDALVGEWDRILGPRDPKLIRAGTRGNTESHTV